MAYAQDYYVDSVKSGGRVVVSGDVTVAEKIIPEPDLATLWIDPTHGDPTASVAGTGMWEVVMAKGTIVAFTYDDATGEFFAQPCDPTADGDPKPLSVAVAQGVLVQDAFRPFERGDQAGISFVTGGYIELPMVDGLNGTLRPGDYVKSDTAGRFVAWTSGVDADSLRIGLVKAVELFEAEDGNPAGSYDFGMLNYMLLPADEFNAALLDKVYSVTPDSTIVEPLFGVRGNLDVTDVVGAMRINLFNMQAAGGL